MTNKDKLRAFVMWCARNVESESRILSHGNDPGGRLDYFDTLDQVVETLGVSEDDVAAWVDEVVLERILAKRDRGEALKDPELHMLAEKGVV